MKKLIVFILGAVLLSCGGGISPFQGIWVSKSSPIQEGTKSDDIDLNGVVIKKDGDVLLLSLSNPDTHLGKVSKNGKLDFKIESEQNIDLNKNVIKEVNVSTVEVRLENSDLLVWNITNEEHSEPVEIQFVRVSAKELDDLREKVKKQKAEATDQKESPEKTKKGLTK